MLRRGARPLERHHVDPRPPQGERRPEVELGAGDAGAGDPEAVGAAEVPHHVAAVAGDDLAVPRGHGAVVEHHVAREARAERERALAEGDGAAALDLQREGALLPARDDHVGVERRRPREVDHHLVEHRRARRGGAWRRAERSGARSGHRGPVGVGAGDPAGRVGGYGRGEIDADGAVDAVRVHARRAVDEGEQEHEGDLLVAGRGHRTATTRNVARNRRRAGARSAQGVPLSMRVRLRRRRAASLAFFRRLTEGFM